MIQKDLKSVQTFRAEGKNGPLSNIVFDWLEIMEDVVNRPKDRHISANDWSALAALVDTENFERIGNYGEQVRWDDYVKLLVRWANSSWWKGRIWRIWEVPGFVFCETQERSNREAPVDENGAYRALDSFCVYEFDQNSKIRHLYVYDQRPLDDSPSGNIVRSNT